MAQEMLDLHIKLKAATQDTNQYANIKQEIEKQNREIDEALYKPYGLTEDEITLVENKI